MIINQNTDIPPVSANIAHNDPIPFFATSRTINTKMQTVETPAQLVFDNDLILDDICGFLRREPGNSDKSAYGLLVASKRAFEFAAEALLLEGSHVVGHILFSVAKGLLKPVCVGRTGTSDIQGTRGSFPSASIAIPVKSMSTTTFLPSPG